MKPPAKEWVRQLRLRARETVALPTVRLASVDNVCAGCGHVGHVVCADAARVTHQKMMMGFHQVPLRRSWDTVFAPFLRAPFLPRRTFCRLRSQERGAREEAILQHTAVSRCNSLGLSLHLITEECPLWLSGGCHSLVPNLVQTPSSSCFPRATRVMEPLTLAFWWS